jgi:hypothetical protein
MLLTQFRSRFRAREPHLSAASKRTVAPAKTLEEHATVALKDNAGRGILAGPPLRCQFRTHSGLIGRRREEGMIIALYIAAAVIMAVASLYFRIRAATE